MDPWLVVGAFAALGLGFGSCLIGYAIITRWPTSPAALKHDIDTVSGHMSALRAEWNDTLEAFAGQAGRIDANTKRLRQQQDRAERKQAQTTGDDLPDDELEFRRLEMMGSGIMSRAGR